MPSRRRTAVLAALAAFALALLPATGPARAVELVPGILFALGERFDRSFNESASAASERLRAGTGIAALEYQPATLAQFDQGIAAMVRHGATLIVVIGFYYARPLAEAAAYSRRRGMPAGTRSGSTATRTACSPEPS